MINKYSTQILINFKALRKQLKEEYRYTEKDVLHTVWRLINADDEIKVSFAKWFNDDIAPRLECEGITWDDLIQKRGLNPFNAFLFMDTMKKDPDKGFELLKGQERPSLRISIDQLRPELRDYVKGKMAEESKEREIKEDPNGDINLK